MNILNGCNGLTATQTSEKTGLSYKTVCKYLNQYSKAGYVSVSKNRVWSVTSLGKKAKVPNVTSNGGRSIPFGKVAGVVTPKSTVIEVAARLNISKNTAYNRLRRSVQNGFIQTVAPRPTKGRPAFQYSRTSKGYYLARSEGNVLS